MEKEKNDFDSPGWKENFKDKPPEEIEKIKKMVEGKEDRDNQGKKAEKKPYLRNLIRSICLIFPIIITLIVLNVWWERERKAFHRPISEDIETSVKRSIKACEYELAKHVLCEYGDRVCKKVSEKLKAPSLFGLNLWYIKALVFYTPISSSWLAKECDLRIVAHDITVIDKNSAKGRILIQPVSRLPSQDFSKASVELFNAIHAEPYKFLVAYIRYGDKWKIKDWKMIGKDWDHRVP